jgi:hypothetical protein
MITIAFDIPTSIETVNDIPDLVHVGLTFLTQLDWLLCGGWARRDVPTSSETWLD